jgi:hypothetical protein
LIFVVIILAVVFADEPIKQDHALALKLCTQGPPDAMITARLAAARKLGHEIEVSYVVFEVVLTACRARENRKRADWLPIGRLAG